jgi:hypothetical protein
LTNFLKDRQAAWDAIDKKYEESEKKEKLLMKKLMIKRSFSGYEIYRRPLAAKQKPETLVKMVDDGPHRKTTIVADCNARLSIRRAVSRNR